MPHRSDRHEQWAIFWCSLLQPLICNEIPPEEAGEFLRALADTEHLFPNVLTTGTFLRLQNPDKLRVS